MHADDPRDDGRPVRVGAARLVQVGGTDTPEVQLEAALARTEAALKHGPE
ncbi:hypothetical protein [Nocardioides halotolerans]|nr:hypothetical protein [Nocardioides halotolerans]